MRLTIGTKLIGLVTLLLLGSEGVLVGLSTQLFIEDNSALIQQMNSEKATNVSAQIRSYLQAYADQLAVIAEVWIRDRARRDESTIKKFFESQPDLVMLRLYENDFEGAAKRKAELFAEDLAGSEFYRNEQEQFILPHVTEARMQRSPAIQDTRVLTARLEKTAVLVMAVPLREGRYLAAWLTYDRIMEPLRTGEAAGGLLIDKNGLVLARSDGRSPELGEHIGPVTAFRKLREGNIHHGQTVFQDPQSGERRLVAFRSFAGGELAVVTEIPEGKAFEAVDRLRFRAELVAIVVLCISLVAGYYYSETISAPIRDLVDAAERISMGDYKISITPRSKDELSDLAHAFNAMAEGLEDRNRMKETFSKFHNKEIAEKLLSAKVRLGGEKKEATILFADIRDFTSLTENMDPEKVVEMLNEYLTRMVAVIRTYGGVVDKYIGDAIMALWGIPEGQPDDCVHAVRCCLEIREELHRFNSLRVARGEPALRIGMGLNNGNVVAGNIGSPKKMEYTVVGDAVNVASRIESTTKLYQTDFLISRTVYDKVFQRFIVEPCYNAKVKGKVLEVEIFKVRGYISESGKGIIVPENQVHIPSSKLKSVG